MSTSSELVALYRSQVALLTQSLGATLSIVYLTEELLEEGETQTKLIPIVAYPEATWQASQSVTITPEISNGLLPLLSDPQKVLSLKALPPESLLETQVDESSTRYSLLPSTQIILPLMHDNIFMGLLVTNREHMPWNERERNEIERIGQTLALARVLEQRREWYEQQFTRQQDLVETQRDLLDSLVHQLRNPLTALRTFGKLLIKRFVPGDPNRKVAENIVRESDRIQELLKQFDRVIELTPQTEVNSELFVNPLVLEPVQPVAKPLVLLPNIQENAEPCSMADILAPLLDSSRAIAQERHLNIQLDIPTDLPLVSANPVALREVLSNLLDNALKYTPPGGQIYIQAGQATENFQGIAISDTGPGIPAQDLEHMFERHYRGVQAASRIPGTGLGLAIAKDLVEQMQGKIQVFSPAQNFPNSINNNPGTTFVVWLPLAKKAISC
ncbi:sensor histidine kinase [Gloeocapsopsis dulcis]|uniref:histidine kinase n=2 Tax=Gloeocapsopsis TaxID=693222 RepID=A0A6N8G304_9CHRO|nr:HAMP domain-containing sensor histidine kinase [Gloeocapsopsis dulcis]MUL38526.1 sensor histidine kinase [Gloeocapsopsis dulcis AAB1 = 1H9]WNN90656.1 HAMP domain-containing sensor histidine kinase [Gloeocapsopsis dulcis]